MNIISRTAATLAVTASALAAFAVVAPAASAATPEANAPSPKAADGYVYVWDGANKTGAGCAWSGNDGDWSACTDRSGAWHNLRNKAGSLYNNGYAATNDKVNFYWGTNYTGSWACLGRGDSWPNLPAEGHTFTWGVNLPGYREPINNNISSHKWVSYCGH